MQWRPRVCCKFVASLWWYCDGRLQLQTNGVEPDLVSSWPSSRSSTQVTQLARLDADSLVADSLVAACPHSAAALARRGIPAPPAAPAVSA